MTLVNAGADLTVLDILGWQDLGVPVTEMLDTRVSLAVETFAYGDDVLTVHSNLPEVCALESHAVVDQPLRTALETLAPTHPSAEVHVGSLCGCSNNDDRLLRFKDGLRHAANAAHHAYRMEQLVQATAAARTTGTGTSDLALHTLGVRGRLYWPAWDRWPLETENPRARRHLGHWWRDRYPGWVKAADDAVAALREGQIGWDGPMRLVVALERTEGPTWRVWESPHDPQLATYIAAGDLTTVIATKDRRGRRPVVAIPAHVRVDDDRWASAGPAVRNAAGQYDTRVLLTLLTHLSWNGEVTAEQLAALDAATS